MARGRFKNARKAQTVAGTDFNGDGETSAPLPFRELAYCAAAGRDRSVGIVSTENSPSGSLMTLMFDERSAQHGAMARIEAFYEAGTQNEGRDRRYLTLVQADEQRICPNYQAFNCPMSGVRHWLEAMQAYHGGAEAERSSPPPQDPSEPFWFRHTNRFERALLVHLEVRGCLSISPPEDSPRYLVTALASQARTSLAHEQLHFLYFQSPSYRHEADALFGGLSRAARKIVETDLRLRRYAEHVWPDEFQAYVSENLAEFGAKPVEELTPIRARLRTLQHSLWLKLAET